MKQINLSYTPFSSLSIHLSSAEDRSVFLVSAPCRVSGARFPSAVVVLPPNAHLRIFADEPGDLYEIRYSPRLQGPCKPVVISGSQGNMARLFLSVFDLLRSASAPDRLTEQTLDLLLQWLQHYAPKEEEESPPLFPHCRQLSEEARKIIHEEYAGDLTLESLAERLYVSPCYLSTVFHRNVGVTFRSYLRSVRLEQARQLVLNTNMQITDIAMQVGFNSSAYLIRSFREVYRVTPLAMRQQEFR